MAARARGESFSDVAVKKDEMEKDDKQREELYALLEAELKVSEDYVEKAEARYKQACERIERELGKKDLDLSALEPAEGDLLHEKEVEEKALAAADEEKLPEKGHKTDKVTHAHELHAGKNSKVVPEKVLSHQKWLQKRSSEHRARESERRARDLRRKGARDQKRALAELPPAGEEAVEIPPARERAGSGDSITSTASNHASREEAVKGAKSIASRLKCIAERPSLSDKRASLLKVLTCGRPNFYCFNPVDVLVDLKERGELEENLSTDLLNILANESIPESTEPVPPTEWLAHAKKMSEFKRLDDAPFKEVEATYFGYLDGRYLKGAEAELEAAEAQLEEAVALATEAYYGHAILEAEKTPESTQADKELEIDEDRVAEQVKPSSEKAREHKGSKNTKVLPSKVVSCQKWLENRGKETRARDAQKKARDLLRASMRDGKRGAGGGYAAA